MEGVITCGVALLAFAFIVKFPDQEKAKRTAFSHT